MAARELMEGAVILIRDAIKANIAHTLSNVRADRADAKVSTEPPDTTSYFIYPKAKGLRPPCIFIIGEDMDFRKKEKASNFINASNRINVAILVEAQDQEKLTLKSWRYQAALHQILDEAVLTSAVGATNLKLVIQVMRATFSPQYTDAKDASLDTANFRQEVILECQVEHYENF